MKRLLVLQQQTNCPNCPLSKKTKQIYTPTDATGIDKIQDGLDILFVGGANGFEEDRGHMPFVGAAGRVLRELVDKFNVGHDYKIGYTNVVRCRPVSPSGTENRPATDVEIGFCSPYTKLDIKQLKPRVVVLLGNLALSTLNPDKEDEAWASGKVGSARISAVKQKQLKDCDYKTLYFSTFHPSFLHNNHGAKKMFEADIRKVFELRSGKRDLNNLAARAQLGVSKLATTIKQVDKVFDTIENLGPDYDVAMDTETLGLNRVGENAVLTWQFAWDEDFGWTIPYSHFQSPWNPEEFAHVTKRLKRIFKKQWGFRYWVMHNGKFDTDKAQRFLGIKKLGNPVFDTMFAAYMLDENRVKDAAFKGNGPGPYSLKTLAPEWLEFHEYSKLQEALDSRGAGNLSTLALDKLSEYAAMDAYVTLRLKNQILDMAGSYAQKLEYFTTTWYSEVLQTLCYIERNGIRVDKRQLFYLQGPQSPIITRMDEIKNKLFTSEPAIKANKALLKQDNRTKGMQSLFGGKKDTWMLDLGKKEHLIELYIRQLGLDVVGGGKPSDKYKSGVPSIDKDFYKHHKGVESVDLLSEYVGMNKLRTSYTNNIFQYVTNNPDMLDSRVRPGLLLTRTVTGRMATIAPNTGQIPRADTPAKQEIKSMFIADDDRMLLEADYSQSEIRWWAQIADDKEYADVFFKMLEIRGKLFKDPTNEALQNRVKNECDVHRQSAAMMFRVSIPDVTDDMRQAAKNLVFGCLFGQSIQALALILKISEQEAAEIQKKFLFAFKRAAQWLFDIEAYAEKRGYVETPMGRRRHLEAEFASGIKGVINTGKRLARNSPIQAASSDNMIYAGAKLQNIILEEKLPWRIINLVHDAIYLEVPRDIDVVAKAIEYLETSMVDRVPGILKEEFGINLIVPFEVEAKIGTRMGHMEKVAPDKPLEKVYAKLMEATKQPRILHVRLSLSLAGT